MEFIIVLPLYMILLGMVFFYGELSLHGVNLAASADRTSACAMGGEGWSGWNGYSAFAAERDLAKAISPSRDLEDTDLSYHEGGAAEKPSSYTRRHAGKVADPSFNGSWTWFVAATVEDRYAMTPWTRGMVGTWAHLERLVNMTRQPDEVAGDSVLGTLFGGGLGRVAMTGKDGVTVGGGAGGARKYSYYTLTRNSLGRMGASYRQWYPGSLVDAAYGSAKWNTCVYGEGWQLAEEYSTLGGVNKGASPTPGTYRPSYERYGQFITWSE